MASPTDPLEGTGAGVDALFSCLASGRRRGLLRYVYDHSPDPTSRDDLATHLAARQHGKQRDEVTDEERQQVLVDLHHVQLPKLADAELIELGDDETVAIADHPAYADADILGVITDQEPGDARPLDVLFDALASPRARIVLDVLSHQYQAIQTETLAREIVAREGGTAERDVPTEEVERLLVSLRHAQLPKLHDAGLIEYDAEEQTVSYEGHPALRVSWMHSKLADSFRESLTDSWKPGDADGPKPGEIETIEGREKIVSYGQSLCESADDELFLMFTTTGLLEAGCFTRIEDAVDRGVDVYLGTNDPTVRAFVRERASDVTLWEPQVDWLGLPVQGNKVGRLVFADREAVMLGTLGAKGAEGVHEERAIVGEGADNALVVLLGQLLSTHLDRLGAEPEGVHPGPNSNPSSTPDLPF